MKKVLITGANSYIGTSFSNMMMNFPDQYIVDTLDMIGTSWKNADFSQYDCIFHVAGIAHIAEKKSNQALYYSVNRDLAIDTAKKAKSEGVGQFIILSSMSVYGRETGVINKETIPYPTSHYGKSKLQADEIIQSLNDESFTIAIIRPPMVYGKGCKGNYRTLSKYAVKLPVFPDVDNARSMISIENLIMFVKNLIDCGDNGLFFPQNREYVNTSNMIKLIAKVHGKNILLTKLFNPIIKIAKIKVIKKIFGTLIYEKEDVCDFICFEDSIYSSEM